MKNRHDTSNLASQRYTGSRFKKGTNSIAYKIVIIISEITGYPFPSSILMEKHKEAGDFSI